MKIQKLGYFTGKSQVRISASFNYGVHLKPVQLTKVFSRLHKTWQGRMRWKIYNEQIQVTSNEVSSNDAGLYGRSMILDKLEL